MILRIMIGEMMCWLRPYGLRRSSSSDRGSSVASDSDASVSCSRLIQIICTALIGELCTHTTTTPRTAPPQTKKMVEIFPTSPPQSYLGRARRSRTIMQRSPHCLKWDAPNLSLPFRRSPPDLIHPSLDRPHSPSQKTASGSNQPFCHSALSGPADRLTDRQTDTHT